MRLYENERNIGTQPNRKVKGNDRGGVRVEGREIGEEERPEIMEWRQDAALKWLLDKGMLFDNFRVFCIF